MCQFRHVVLTNYFSKLSLLSQLFLKIFVIWCKAAIFLGPDCWNICQNKVLKIFQFRHFVLTKFISRSTFRNSFEKFVIFMENVVTRKLLVAFKIVLLWVLITPNCVFWYSTLVFVPLDLWRQSPIASLSSPSPLPFVTKAIGKKEKQMAFYSVCKTKLRIAKAFLGVRNWWFYFFAAPFLQKERFFFLWAVKWKS